MAGNYLINVPKLRGRENYDEWAFAAENFLILEGVDINHRTKEDDAVVIQKAKAKLVMTIDPSLYVHIKCETTVYDVWKKLKNLFDDTGFTRRISLLRSLISIRLESSDSMTSYVSQLVDTAQKLKGTGFAINDEWIGSLLLAGLPEKFSPMIMAIEHSGMSITADAIKTKLLDMSYDVGSNEPETAFISKNKYGNRQKKGIKSGNTFDASTSSKSNVKIVKCYKCKQTGHYKNQCPLLKDKQVNAFSAVFLNGQFSQRDWYVDSGASTHMIASEKDVINKSHNLTTKEIIVANQVSVPVLCTGDTLITTIVNNTEHEIVVKNVLCVPNLTTNLLSVSRLIENGNKVSFQKGYCYIRNQQNRLLGVAELVNGVYQLNIKSDSLLAATAATSSMVWHRRLGHINSKHLEIMKNGAVVGLSYNDKADASKSNCTVCCEGKQSRLPFPQSSNRSDALLQVVHVDVCGPMENKSIGQSRYFLLLVDDYSRMTFVYFLKNKSEVFNKFKLFKKMVETQTNKSIKVLRSDNGREFCSNEMSDFLKASGILHQRTNPYTPEQNGLCERFNRTIVEKARCLLFDAKLHKQFWAEAVHTAVYLKNRTPAASLNEKTPYELWTGKKPDISHVRIFGSKVMVHVPKERRLKWDKKATEHYLLGYGDNVKGYRLYNPVTRKIITSRDVTIMESNTSDLVQAIVDERIQSSNSKRDSVSENKNNTNTDLSQTTVMSDDSTYFLEDTTINSSEEFYDVSNNDESPNITLPDPVIPQKEKRTRKHPDRYGYSQVCVGVDVNSCDDQITLESAMNGPESVEWNKAMQEELQSFEDTNAWELVDIPVSGTIVKCKWVLKKKFDSDNKVRYRARLVAKGFMQKKGVDYDETFSPVVRHATLRLLFALAVKLNLDITHLDVTTAFLNGDLEETIFMQKPEGFPESQGNGKVLKLKKAIYGLKQSSRAWYKKVDDCLLGMGYKSLEIESCLYIRNNNGCKTIVTLYVDDFFVFSNDVSETENLKQVLSSNFKLKDMGVVKQCLGMSVNVNKNKGVITLSQESYINQLLIKFNMTDSKTFDTPMEDKLHIVKEENCNLKVPYQQLIGSLMYLAVLTRPDIMYSVSFLSQFNNSFNSKHWMYAKRILKYLKKTKSFGLTYTREGNSELVGYVDADWGNDIVDRRSYSGVCFVLCGGAISWSSRKQKSVALSSTEAEYMAITEACTEAIYLRNILLEISDNIYTVNIFNDNQGALKLSANSVFHNRTKHIDVRYHFCRDCVNNKIVNLKYLETARMPADMLTKSLGCVKHYMFMEMLGIKIVT